MTIPTDPPPEPLLEQTPPVNPRSWQARLGGKLWHHPDFVRLWAADAISQFGTQITAIALPLLAVVVLEASPFEVGLLVTFETIAFLLVGLPAGAWIDRMRIRNVLMVSDLLRAGLLASLPIAALMDALTIGQMYVVAVLFGICTVFFDVSYQSYLPILVERSDLVEGNAKLEATRAVSMVAGPGLGGFIVQWLKPVNAIVIDSLSYLWSAFWISRITARQDRPPRKPDANIRREIKEGLRFVLKHPLLRAIAMTTGTSNFFNSVGYSMLMVLLARDLGLSAGTIGLMFSVASVGAFVGIALVGPATRKFGQGPTIWLSIIVVGPTLFIAPFMQDNWTIWLYAVGSAIFSAGVVAYNITQVSFRQAMCPPELLGRMNATMRFLVWGTMPLGGLVGAFLGSGVGVRETLLFAAVGGALSFLPAFLSPLRWMRELPKEWDALSERKSDSATGDQVSGAAKDDPVG